MKVLINVFFLSLCLMACKVKTEKIKEVSEVTKEEKLLTTILNLPKVLKFSKISLIEQHFSSIELIIEKENNYSFSNNLKQGNLHIKIVQNKSLIQTKKEPCYVIEKLEFNDDMVNVLIFLDLTGLVIDGQFSFIKGEWVPDENLIIGVR